MSKKYKKTKSWIEILNEICLNNSSNKEEIITRRYPIKFLITEENIDEINKIRKQKHQKLLDTQKTFFNKTCGCKRFAQSWAIDMFKDDLEHNTLETSKSKETVKIENAFNKFKKQKGFEWLLDCDTIATSQAVQLGAETAWDCSNNKITWAHKPVKKDKQQSYDTTIRVNNGAQLFEDDYKAEFTANKKAYISLPKLGRVQVNRFQPLGGKPTGNIKVVQEEDGQFYVCITVKKQNKLIHFGSLSIKKAVGIDMGAKTGGINYFVDNDENQIVNNKFENLYHKPIQYYKNLINNFAVKLENLSRKLNVQYDLCFGKRKPLNKIEQLEIEKKLYKKRLTKSTPRSCKISFNKFQEKQQSFYNHTQYRKIKEKFNKAWSYFNRLRKSFIQKVAYCYCLCYDVIGLETLNVGAMKQSSKTPASKVIQRFPMYEFKLAILQFANNLGKIVINIGPEFPSSQLCPKCGRKHKEMKSVKTEMNCVCGYSGNRDITAAINIKNEAIRILKTDYKSVWNKIQHK